MCWLSVRFVAFPHLRLSSLGSLPCNPQLVRTAPSWTQSFYGLSFLHDSLGEVRVFFRDGELCIEKSTIVKQKAKTRQYQRLNQTPSTLKRNLFP